MENPKETLHNLTSKIKSDSVLFFDMDGTLVDTNFANYLSYVKAIQTAMQTNTLLSYNANERFNRVVLKAKIPNLTPSEYDTIIRLKEEYYKEYLPETKLNTLVADILLEYCKTNTTILVTNCRKERALMTLNYHNLTDKFHHAFYRQNIGSETKINKYKNAISSLKISPSSSLVFENEKLEVNDAILAGVPSNNILNF